MAPKIPGRLHQRIVALLEANPLGLDIEQIRKELALEGQQHLDRRVRDINAWYELERDYGEGGRYVYRLGPPRDSAGVNDGQVSKKIRAQVLNRDGRRCQMCGRTPEDGVRLHVDHKIPRAWGGTNDPNNLWALCAECNEGKQAHFSSLDGEQMGDVLLRESVHERLALYLHHHMDSDVIDDDLEFVANFREYQADWPRRLRELRSLGLNIKSTKRKIGNRVHSFYRLTNWVELPRDPTRAIRELEGERSRKANGS